MLDSPVMGTMACGSIMGALAAGVHWELTLVMRLCVLLVTR
jgi:hypothetical protein